MKKSNVVLGLLTSAILLCVTTSFAAEKINVEVTDYDQIELLKYDVVLNYKHTSEKGDIISNCAQLKISNVPVVDNVTDKKTATFSCGADKVKLQILISEEKFDGYSSIDRYVNVVTNNIITSKVIIESWKRYGSGPKN